jgi:hypothetical protein
MMEDVLRKALAFLAVAAVSALLLTPICGILHRCGCRAPWAGGESYCNVRAAVGPHCPWCEHPVLGGLATTVILGGQLLVFGLVLRRTGIPGAAAAALVALPLLSLAGGALAWLPTDYPHFLVHDARDRLGLPAGPLHCYGGPPHAH